MSMTWDDHFERAFEGALFAARNYDIGAEECRAAVDDLVYFVISEGHEHGYFVDLDGADYLAELAVYSVLDMLKNISGEEGSSFERFLLEVGKQIAFAVEAQNVTRKIRRAVA